MMLVLMVASCTSLNCPLNNTTYTKYKLMGDVKKLNATLTISTTKQEGVTTSLRMCSFLKFRMQTIRYGKIQ